MEFVIDLIVDVLFSIPGGFIRWLFIRKKHTLKEVLLFTDRTNVFIGIILVAVILILFQAT